MRRTARRLFVGGAVLLLVGGTAYKLGQSDVQKVEQAGGKPVDQMSEAELQSAMQRAGVQEQEMTPEDERAMETADREEATGATGAAPTAD